MSLYTKYHVSHKWKTIFFSLAVGGAVIGVTYLWFRRFFKVIESPSEDETDIPTELQKYPIYLHHKLNSYRSNASVASRTSTASGRRSVSNPKLNSPARLIVDSDSEDTSACWDQRRLGLSTLANVVDHLESLMSRVHLCEEKGFVMPSRETEKLIDDLRVLLEQAYKLREQYKQKLYEETEFLDRSPDSDIASEDDTCSFFSASEQLDLTELEILMTENTHNALYYKALQLLEDGEIPYRWVSFSFMFLSFFI